MRRSRATRPDRHVRRPGRVTADGIRPERGRADQPGRGGQRGLGLFDKPRSRLLDLQAAALERLVKIGQSLGQRLA